MKHAAEVLSPSPYHDFPIYSAQSTTPTGTYHWAESKNHKPPLLKKITQTRFEGRFGIVETIWKRGWRHIKGARQRRPLQRTVNNKKMIDRRDRDFTTASLTTESRGAEF